MTKFKVGDQVKVINYGHKVIDLESATGWWDMEERAIGQIGIIKEADRVQGSDEYCLHFPNGFGGKAAWYDNGQLELVHQPKYK